MSEKNLSNFLVSGFSDDEEDAEEEGSLPEEKSKRVLFAAENGLLDELKSILKDNPQLISVSDKEGYTPLHRACYNNHVDVVKYLLESGAPKSAKTELQWEPLHSCCQWGNIKCAQLLINEGADINAPTEGGQTPLHIAATHGACYDVAQLLLFHPQINPNVKNVSGETAFDIARRSSKYRNIFDMVDPLLDIDSAETS